MSILVRPIVTEKMTVLGDKYGRYGFIVKKSANKLEIQKAIETMYGVSVDKVRTLIHGGKRKSRYTKTGIVVGKTPSYKKAIVTLVEGDKIDFYSNI